MPQFYLHVTNGEMTYQDSTGLQLADTAAAEVFAPVIATDLSARVAEQVAVIVEGAN